MLTGLPGNHTLHNLPTLNFHSYLIPHQSALDRWSWFNVFSFVAACDVIINTTAKANDTTDILQTFR